MRIRCLAVFLTLAASLPALAQRTPVPLNEHWRLGQRFTATRPLAGVLVCVPSWSDNEGGLTLSLYDSPARAKLLARRVLTDVRDNEMCELRTVAPLPPGSYYWEISDRSGKTRIGLYCDALPADSPDCAWLDGKPEPRQRFFFQVAAAVLARRSEADLLALLERGTPDEQDEACRDLAVFGTATAVPALSRRLADPKLSHLARYALESLPDPAVDVAFRAALGSLRGPQLIGVTNSVAVRGDAGAVPKLAELLRDADAAVAAAAAVALGRIGTPESAAVLLRLPAPLSPAAAEGCLSCAGRLLAAGRRDLATPLYDRLREPTVPRPLRKAAARGAVLARGADGLALLRQMLRSTDSDLVEVALWVAQHELPGREVTLALAEDLATAPAALQPRLVASLAGRRDEAALPALQQAALTGAKPVALAAVRALATFGGVAAPILLRLLDHAEPELRKAAEAGLAGLAPQDVAKAAAVLLPSAEEPKRLAAIALIRRQRLTGFGPGLAAALRDPSAAVRLAAAQALEETGGKAEVAPLREALVAAADDRQAEALERALAAAASRAGDPEAVSATLLTDVDKLPEPRRAALLRVLGVVGGKRALEAVRQALAGPAGPVRTAALEALCVWSTADAAPDLLKLAQATAQPAEALKALGALLRLAASPDVAPEARLQLCRDAAGLVRRDEEMWLLLSALGGLGVPEALDLALPCLDSPTTREEACTAIVGIAGKLVKGPHAQRLAEPLERVVRVTTKPEVAAKAKALLAQVRQGK